MMMFVKKWRDHLGDAVTERSARAADRLSPSPFLVLPDSFKLPSLQGLLRDRAEKLELHAESPLARRRISELAASYKASAAVLAGCEPGFEIPAFLQLGDNPADIRRFIQKRKSLLQPFGNELVARAKDVVHQRVIGDVQV
ncbi:hypothetical protein ACQ3JU_1225 (plasmid) [Bradyrhizobium guangxiense]